jgi:hypothetical protein
MEEQKYLEKLLMLSKYIEPLRRSVNNLEKNKDEGKHFFTAYLVQVF